MPHHRILLWPCASVAMAVLLAVLITTTGQGSFQAAEKSATGAAQDPFQVAEKAAVDASSKTDKTSEDKKKAEPEFVRKTDEEWSKILPPAVFRVTRWKATEPAFSGQYVSYHGRGTFLCACCAAELFSADHKFDSGTGWPSFWRPISAKATVNAVDNSESEPRIEVICRRCGAHLGHVFDDNPAAPTGLRYCINSLALKLKPLEGAAARTTSAKGKVKSKAKTTLKTRSKSSAKKTPSKATTKTTAPEPQESGEETEAASKPEN